MPAYRLGNISGLKQEKMTSPSIAISIHHQPRIHGQVAMNWRLVQGVSRPREMLAGIGSRLKTEIFNLFLI